MKNKKTAKGIITGVFVLSMLLGVKINYASAVFTQAELKACVDSGGTGLSYYEVAGVTVPTGNCENCPKVSGIQKVSNNGVCVDPTMTGPSVIDNVPKQCLLSNVVISVGAVLKAVTYGGTVPTSDGGMLDNENDCKSACTNGGYKSYSFNSIINLMHNCPAGGGGSGAGSTQTITKFDYPLLESFPGFFKAGTVMNDLPTMILSIYKFGIWTVGIAGLFMLVVGGFMYMTSAGNTSTAGNARGIIWDALLGIVAALGAYLILYVINPDLTKINLSFTPVAVAEQNDFGGTLESDSGNQSTAGGCIKPVNEARKALNANWVYSQAPDLRGKIVGGVRYTDCSNLVETAYKLSGCNSPGGDTASMYARAVPFNNKSELKAGDAVVRIGNVVLCIDDGCNKIIHAPGTGKPITVKNGSWTTGKSGDWTNAKVIRASRYCGSC